MGMGNRVNGSAVRRLCLLLCCLAVETISAETNVPTVGMEGKVEVLLPGTQLDARPVNPRSLVTLRIADTRPHGTLIHYDLRYIGLVPGRYDLRDYLLRKDGSPTNDLPPIPVVVSGLLSEKHQGELAAQAVRPMPFLGGYKTALTIAGAVWALVFLPLWLSGRQRKTAAPAPVPSGPPSLAERLKPLVAGAAEGKLSRDELAQLERLLLSHWRERLALGELSMIEAVQRLREHPEGGVLLRQLEDWLHRPPGAVKVDVEALLAPYRELPRPKVPDLEVAR
jgi:hypothetical protein